MHEYNGMCQEPNACVWITPATFSFVGFHLEMLPGHWQFRPFLIAIELLSDVHTGALSLRFMSEHLLSDPQTHDQGNGRGGKVYHTFSSFVKSWAVNERRGANQVCLRHKFQLAYEGVPGGSWNLGDLNCLIFAPNMWSMDLFLQRIYHVWCRRKIPHGQISASLFAWNVEKSEARVVINFPMLLWKTLTEIQFVSGETNVSRSLPIVCFD